MTILKTSNHRRTKDGKFNLHIETCDECGGLCGNFGSDGWMCTKCWASCEGPSWDDE